ncbi:hypothetical protein MRX96_009577 [Rhipicephalus microplus]
MESRIGVWQVSLPIQMKGQADQRHPRPSGLVLVFWRLQATTHYLLLRAFLFCSPGPLVVSSPIGDVSTSFGVSPSSGTPVGSDSALFTLSSIPAAHPRPPY